MSAPLRILMVCNKFAADAAQGWLTNDLAQALDAQGHTVDIIHLEWQTRQAPQLVPLHARARVLHVSALSVLPAWLPSKLALLLKWIAASTLAARVARTHFPPEPYDLLIGFSPAMIIRGLVRAYYPQAKKRVLIYWDFFPRHHREIGVLPLGELAEPIAHDAEAEAVSVYDAVGCMSPANMAFFQRYFPKYAGEVVRVPVWGPASALARTHRNAARMRYGFGADDVVCVFGGQLNPGRGIDGICDLAARVAETLPQAKFVIAGCGAYAETVAARAAQSPNLRYLGQLSREEYGQLLAAADIGLVFTPAQVSLPTFPSKTVDYLRASLPVLAAVETAGDYAAILEHEMQAGFACAADDMAQIDANLAKLVQDAALRARCGAQGWQYYQTHMTADIIAAQLAGLA